MKTFLLIIISFFTLTLCYGQYSISGYVDTEQKEKTVYLSLLKYNEEYTISSEQIIFSTKTDSSGYFEFKGQLLPEKDKYYRIHANLRDDESSRQLVNSDSISNFHNFIFSNNDTIFFPKTENFWFTNSTNTNSTDRELLKLKQFSQNLLQDFSQNNRITIETVDKFATQLKQYTQDSVRSPLVKLLAISIIQRNKFDLKKDFEHNADFYNMVQQDLFDYYGNTSYYSQLQDEISKISYTLIYNKYLSYKKWNYLLIAIIIVLALAVVLLFRKIKSLRQDSIEICTDNLTAQEIKIAKLICDNKTNKEIADELFISMSTLKTHIGNLYTKVNAANRKDFLSKFKNHTWC